MSSGRAVEMTTLEEFRRRRAAGWGVFVIVGRPSGRVLVHDVGCPVMTDEAFAKLVRRRRRKGRSVWMTDAEAAIAEFDAVRCRHPADPV